MACIQSVSINLNLNLTNKCRPKYMCNGGKYEHDHSVNVLFR